MKRFLFLACLLLSIQSLSAQKTIVVADIETFMPISDVSVRSKSGVEVTDSSGVITIAEDSKTLIFTHLNYESLMLNTSEIGDTVYLISKMSSLQEVVVFGQDKNRELPDALRDPLGMTKTDIQLAGASLEGGFNLFGLIKSLIPKKWLKNRKKDRVKDILDNY